MTNFKSFSTLVSLSLLVLVVSSAPLDSKRDDEPDPVADTRSGRSKGSSRSARYLGSSWFDFLNPGGFQDPLLSRAAEEDNSSNQADSPIYYIRLPANPYVYMPGMGYVSRPQPLQTPVQSSPPPVVPPRPASPFYQLPLDFVSNGKPGSTVQIWPRDPTPAPFVPVTTTTTVSPPTRKPQVTTVNRLPGNFFFNGKPSGFYILQQDPYNSLYADVLHNFYP